MLTESYYHDTRYPRSPHNLPEIWENAANQNTGRHVIWPEPYEKLTHKQAYDQAMLISKGLLAMGLKRGDTFCCFGSRGSDSVLMFIACSSLGIKFMAKPDAVLIGDHKSGENNEQVCVKFTEVISELTKEANAHQISHILYDRKAEHDSECTIADGWKSLGSIMELAQSVSDDALKFAKLLVGKNEPCLYSCSSGSTGEPKLVLLGQSTYTNLAVDATGSSDVFKVYGMPDMAEEEIVLIGNLVVAFIRSADLVIFPVLRAHNPSEAIKKLLASIEKYRVEIAYYDQGIITQIVNNEKCRESYDLSSLECLVIAGSISTQSFKQKLLLLAPLSIDIYGCTEFFTPVQPVQGILQSRPTSVGQPSPNVELKIIDDNGDIVPINTRGQICLRGVYMFLEYKDQPELTAKARDKDGWYLTGDLASMDRLGYIYIYGRIATAQRWKVEGDTVYSIAIESVLRSHPKIHAGAVFGTPAEGTRGHEINYVVVPIPSSGLTAEEVKEFSTKNMTSSIEWPVRIFIYSDEKIPKTAGARRKINKPALEKEIASRIAQDPTDGLV